VLVAALLRRFTPHTVFMEIGAGDCSLAILAASYVERVYAVDPGERIGSGRPPPGNLRLVLSEEPGIAVPEGSVDLAYSARPNPARLRLAHRSLATGGIFVTSDLGARAAARAAGFVRVRKPWFEPVLVAVKS
jgi:hypothetical protein